MIALLTKKFISQICHGTFSKNIMVLKYLLRYVSLLRSKLAEILIHKIQLRHYSCKLLEDRHFIENK